MYSFFHIQANISHPPAYGTIITEILKQLTSNLLNYHKLVVDNINKGIPYGIPYIESKK